MINEINNGLSGVACRLLISACRFLILGLTLAAHAGELLTLKPSATDFVLSAGRGAATIYVEQTADYAIARAANDLALDVERVTDRKPVVSRDAGSISGDVVIVGVIGRSALLDGLVLSGKLDAPGLKGSWESYVIQVVDSPLPNIRCALVIAGSDQRGAIFGLYEISEAIGVSPWYWWADVTPTKQKQLGIVAGTRRFGPPSVKYRGIFINDEDWGLQPWAARTHEPEAGDIGPKTYARVFELLLRLKANVLWPAMHPSTKPFNAFPENKIIASNYGIVMGSSHAEPMLRNNVGEWKYPPSSYNYISNRPGVLRYWEERLQENGRFENIYTVGMRGVHDSSMLGPRTDEERIAALEGIFTDQRALLRKYARDGEAAPQIFCAYKEVLELYRQGLKVPDDITIVWPDDNFGYVRNFATSKEQRRSGGFGVYYHLSYLGAPLAYLWLNTTPPGLIWEEMHKAFEHGADRFWMANVGDIKPAEIGIELFLQMAWDIRKWSARNLNEYLFTWATREFGSAQPAKIAAIMTEYYRLNFVRKPEHLQWWLPGQLPRESPFTPDQVAARLSDFNRMVDQTVAVEPSVPPAKRDAFFELVKYPVLGSSAANQRYFHNEAYNRLFNHDLPVARQHANLARTADQTIIQLTRQFNEAVAGGKWRHLMSVEPADGQWRTMRIAPPALPSESLTAPRVDSASLSFGTKQGNGLSNGPTPIEIDPAKFTANIAAGGASWTALPAIARTGTMITVLPTTAPSVEPGPPTDAAPLVDYTVELPEAGNYRVTLHVLPTHPLVWGRLPRVSIRLGDAPVQILKTGVLDSSPEWAQAVLDNAVPASADFAVPHSGRARLRIQMIDTGVVIEAITLDSAETGSRTDSADP